MKIIKSENISVDKKYAEKLWDDIEGFAAYAFNASHSYSYAVITYTTLYLKANYPLQFYTALMTIKSTESTPEKWQEKVNEYMNELKYFGIELKSPDINKSDVGFYAKDNKIYYGLAGIKSLAKGTVQTIVSARIKGGPFKDIFDFFERINLSKVNTGKFEALVKSGCFDRMGYPRQLLLDNIDNLFSYYRDLADYKVKIIDWTNREKLRESILKAREEGKDTEKLPSKTKCPVEPIRPLISQSDKISISANQLMDQASYIGCYIGKHPASMISGDFTTIDKLWIGDSFNIRFLISSMKEIKTKKGEPMCFLKLEDETGSCEAVVFSSVFKKINNLAQGKLGKAWVKVENENPMKVIINKIEVIN